jgi:transcriptional regulator with GAF, ATPase, and Fis domain
MPYTSISQGEQIAKTLLEKINSNIGFSENTHFSIGLAHSIAGDRQPIELFRRTTLALNSARSTGGSKLVVWNEGLEETKSNRTSEIQMERESRNVVLLWNVMNVLSHADSLESLCRGFCEQLFHFFNFDRIALLAKRNASLEATTAFMQGKGAIASISELDLGAAEFELIDSLMNDGSGDAKQDRVWLFDLGEQRVLFLDPVAAEDRAQSDFLMTLVAYFSASMSRFELAPESEPVDDFFRVGNLIYRSPQLGSIMESVKLVAPTDATVLITGDTGTGKEMFARHVHNISPRRDQPFIIVDCGAIVGSLIESELFGHVRGAFTGADKNFSGRLKEADGGTLVLDEIGELPLDVQVKLLRFVQEREIAAVGATEYFAVDTRIIAATNKDLKKMVEEGTFREDLYYRLNVFTIETPRLKDREEDILLLAEHYLRLYAQRYSKGALGFSLEAEQALLQYEWPGNVRELTNVINRAVILCKDTSINPIHLGLFSKAEVTPVAKPTGQVSLREQISELVDRSLAMNPDLPPVGLWLEEDLILISIDDNSGVLSRAASSLGIPETTLRRKVNRLKDIYGNAIPDRPRGWVDVGKMLPELIGNSREHRVSVLDLVSQSLAREIESRNLLRQESARLMGVSVPTYRKLIG